MKTPYHKTPLIPLHERWKFNLGFNWLFQIKKCYIISYVAKNRNESLLTFLLFVFSLFIGFKLPGK